MNLKIVILDEPIHIYNSKACKLWQNAIWAKELGYKSQYKSSILPIGTDDFFGTHLIVVNELSDGDWDPVVMYKVVRRTQSNKFNVPFGAISLLKGTKYENSIELQQILEDPAEISYDSSWSINPKYKKDKEFSTLLRDYITLFCCNIHQIFGYNRWLTAGVQKFKIDEYFSWLGCKKILPDFELLIIDNDKVSMFYVPDAASLSKEAKAVAKKLSKEWDNKIIFQPDRLSEQKVA